MRSVKLYQVKSLSNRRGGRPGKIGNDGVNLLDGHRLRRRIVPESHIRRSQYLPTALGYRHHVIGSVSRRISGALATGVANLYRDFGVVTVLVHEVVDALPCRYLRVVPEASIPRRNTPLRIHRGRLGDDKCRPTRGKRT